MELKNFFAQDLQGNVIPSPTVYLYQPGTTTLATGLQDANGAALINPFNGDGNGQVVLAAPDGDYDLKVEGAGRTTTMRVRFADNPALRVELASNDEGKGAGLVAADDGKSGSMWTTVKGFIDFLLSSLGASIIGFIQDEVGAVCRSVMDKLRERVSVKDFGAKGDGVADDTAAIQACINASRNVYFPAGSYKVTSTLTIPSYRTLVLQDCNIAASCGSTPLFAGAIAAEGITFEGNGALITGTASAVFYFEGATFTPSSVSHYAKQIRINGIHAASTTFDIFLDCQKAVRQVFVDGCQIYTNSGFNFNGKCVEAFISNGMCFSSSGAVGTYGLKTRAPGGTTYYNEGIHITNMGWDAFEWAFDVADVFVLTLTGGWISGPNDYAFRIFGRTGTNTHCREINITGVVLGKGIKFEDQATGCNYHMVVGSCVFSGGRISLGNNTYNVGIYSSRFESNDGNVGISVPNNCGGLTFDGLTFDNTHIGGIIINGASGTGIAVKNITYGGTGSPVYSDRAIEIDGCPIQDNAGGEAHISAYAHAQGAWSIGETMASVAVKYPKGTKGFIVAQLACTGMNTGTQRFDVVTPTGMVVPSGSGWSGAYIYPSSASGMVTVMLPFYCTSDVSGNVAIANAAGNTVTINFHSYFGVVRDF